MGGTGDSGNARKKTFFSTGVLPLSSQQRENYEKLLKANEPKKKKKSETKMVLLTRFWNSKRINEELRAF